MSHGHALFLSISPSLVFVHFGHHMSIKPVGTQEDREQQGDHHLKRRRRCTALPGVCQISLSQESHDHSLLNPGDGAHLRPRRSPSNKNQDATAHSHLMSCYEKNSTFQCLWRLVASTNRQHELNRAFGELNTVRLKKEDLEKQWVYTFENFVPPTRPVDNLT